jgi:hypothetical protein
MPLVDLKTDLKSLRFGNDRIGGGSSGQPYITNPIPDGVSTLGILNNDFLLRGGITAVSNTETDVLRLGKMFDSKKSPSGILFTAKQQLLSQTAVRTQTSGILNEGIYTPLSTLAQAGVNAFGGHLNKQGINPFALTGPTSNNENLYDVKMKVNQSDLPASVNDNRLIQLKRNIAGLPGAKNKIDGFNFKSGRTGIFNDDPIMMSYGGGPGSELGIGRTNIYFASSGRFKTLSSPPTVNASTGALNPYGQNGTFPSTLNTSQIESKKSSPGPSQIKEDFRAVLRQNLLTSNEGSKILSNGPSYTGDNVIQNAGGSRINMVDPTTSTRNLISYTNGSGLGPIDKVNARSLYKSDTVSDVDTNDLVKFRIAIIDNQNPSLKTYVHFRAFLGGFSDSYSAGWNPQTYLGRGEKLYTYSGFDRQVSLSWTVAAQSKEELIPMYKKLNYLASTLAPDYKGNGFMKGNLAELTIGGYFHNQPGIITSMNLSIADDTPYEIAINDLGEQDKTLAELPMIVRVDNFNFIPIHNFRPALQENIYGEVNGDGTGDVSNFGDERFIGLNGDGRDESLYKKSTQQLEQERIVEVSRYNSDILFQQQLLSEQGIGFA